MRHSFTGTILLDGVARCLHKYFGLDEADMSVRAKADVVVYGEDRKVRAVSVGEQDLALVEEIVLHQVRSRMRKMAG